MFVSRYAIFLKNEFIQKKGSERNIKLMEVQNLQIDPEIPVVELQEDPQSKVPKDEVHPQYTSPL